MTDAIAVEAPGGADRLEQVGAVALLAIAGALQFSIAAAQILLAVAALFWLAVVIVRRERVIVPRFFWLLAAFAGATLVSAAFSVDPRNSFIDCKQLVLYLVVPITYRLATGTRSNTLATVIITFAAASAVVGIVQYGILHYDILIHRPQGTLGHYMTYSGLLMLALVVAMARTLFGQTERTWAALVIPALAVAIAVTLSRNAWVGVCIATALLLALKDFRLLAVLPIIAAVFVVIAPSTVMTRFQSIFDLRDPTNRDRLAMLREGAHMVRDHPLTGVGPNMVLRVYPEYRDADAVEKLNPHLHNVPMQIAAERGLPALAIWCAFVILLTYDLARLFYAGGNRFLSAAALGAVVAMLTAGLFEHNFGNSEFLMLFLMVVTMPFAAARSAID